MCCGATPAPAPAPTSTSTSTSIPIPIPTSLTFTITYESLERTVWTAVMIAMGERNVLLTLLPAYDISNNNNGSLGMHASSRPSVSVRSKRPSVRPSAPHTTLKTLTSFNGNTRMYSSRYQHQTKSTIFMGRVLSLSVRFGSVRLDMRAPGPDSTPTPFPTYTSPPKLSPYPRTRTRTHIYIPSLHVLLLAHVALFTNILLVLHSIYSQLFSNPFFFFLF